jgi:hypothetical protein
MKKRVTIYWLIPAKPQYELFRELIRILAKQFDAPSFKPHLTLCAAAGDKASRRLLSQIRSGPIRLRVRWLEHSPKFTKALFLPFTPNRSLARLVAELGCNPKALGDPHLSLLYKQFPAAIRRELASTIKFPFRDVVFDAITVMSALLPVESRRDVESWRILGTKRLSG